jgi:hypothetical protein
MLMLSFLSASQMLIEKKGYDSLKFWPCKTGFCFGGCQSDTGMCEISDTVHTLRIVV